MDDVLLIAVIGLTIALAVALVLRIADATREDPAKGDGP